MLDYGGRILAVIMLVVPWNVVEFTKMLDYQGAEIAGDQQMMEDYNITQLYYVLTNSNHLSHFLAVLA